MHLIYSPAREISKADLLKELEIRHPTGGSSAYFDFVFRQISIEWNDSFTFYDIMSALSITSLGNTCSVQRRLQSVFIDRKIFDCFFKTIRPLFLLTDVEYIAQNSQQLCLL